MNIKETFLNLTSRTYPHGHEGDLFHLLPQDLEVDDHGNLFKLVGENPSTMFTSHLDTAGATLTAVNHVIEGDIIKTDGNSILGADDKAGVTVLLYMMENNITGLYYFFLGEEVGCVGSGKLAADHKIEPMKNITKVVSFDRRGLGSIITHQTSTRCCSDEFGTALSNALNSAGAEVYDNDTILSYKNDPTGLYTDSAKFMTIYPECTNLSVGYYDEHWKTERQDIKHLDKLAKAACLVDWESLPIKRDPTKVEYDYGGYRYGYGGDWEDSDYGQWPPSRGHTTYTPVISYDENHWFVDDEHSNYCSYVTVNKLTKRILDTDLADGRIEYERELIGQLLMTLDVDNDDFTWDGFKLIVDNMGNKTENDRNDLIDFIPELDFWKQKSEDHKGELTSFHKDDVCNAGLDLNEKVVQYD